ncbi:hypothetical protein [Streptomyces sp. KL116D]|uniref:hypothetical protein n=1 Tax=Streptomyces sp. KL116D TaxID=3045152 RepID=UPI00355796D6
MLLAQALGRLAIRGRSGRRPHAGLLSPSTGCPAQVGGGRIGAEFAIRQHVQLLVLEMVRAYVDQAELRAVLRVLTDERLRPAVGACTPTPRGLWHPDRTGPRRVPCRTSFAERFREPWRASRR